MSVAHLMTSWLAASLSPSASPMLGFFSAMRSMVYFEKSYAR